MSAILSPLQFYNEKPLRSCKTIAGLQCLKHIFVHIAYAVYTLLIIVSIDLKNKKRIIKSSQSVINSNGLILSPDDFLLQITTAYENAVLYAKVNKLAVTDGVTGLYNHKYFMRELEREIERARRYNFPLSLLFFDIDHFKKFNDLNGHQVGDEVLRIMGKLLVNTGRKYDLPVLLNDRKVAGTGKNIKEVISRYGGEEIAIILPHTDSKGAYTKGERLRAVIEKEHFPCQEKQPLGTLTVSMGVASMDEKVNSAKLLILVADAALYLSKTSGRNKVTVADDGIIESVIQKGQI